MNRKLIFIAWLAVALSRAVAAAQDASARTIQYHSQDIVPIHAKLKYTTLIQVPPTEKIMEAATGDKDFWIVDVVGNFCFVHPAKAGISSNLNLITDKGNIYSFTLQDVSGTSDTPDLKVLIEPADHSSIVAANGPPQFVPAVQLEQTRQQLAALQSHVEQAVDEYKSAYPVQLKFDYTYKSNEAPIDIQSIYHDDKFTYIKTNAPEKFSVYEMKDGKPTPITYDLRDGTYIIPKVMDSGYVELGKKRMDFTRKGRPPWPRTILFHLPRLFQNQSCADRQSIQRESCTRT
jgi:type IV secretion system protein VirB9